MLSINNFLGWWNSSKLGRPSTNERVVVPKGTPLYSYVDTKKEITLELWAISMLIEKGKPILGIPFSEKLTDLVSYHTILIIEGIRSETTETVYRFWQKVHFRGASTCGDADAIKDCFSGHSNAGQVEISKENFSLFRMDGYRPFRQTWVASAEQIQQTLKKLRYEQEHPELTPFRFLGSNSIFSTQIERFETTHPLLIKIQKEDPEKFRDICLIYEKCILIHESGKGAWIRSLHLPTTPMIRFVNQKVLTSDEQSDNLVRYSHLPYSNYRYAATIAKGLFFDIPLLFVLQPLDYIHRKKIREQERLHNEKVGEYGPLLRELGDCIEKITISSHNCFTKARCILGMIDKTFPDEISEKSFEFVGVLPTLYLPRYESPS